jgi:flagellar basal body P-ring protein FlgI
MYNNGHNYPAHILLLSEIETSILQRSGRIVWCQRVSLDPVIFQSNKVDVTVTLERPVVAYKFRE